MSQCYHIELTQTVVRSVTAEDTVSYPIELTEVLPEEEMREVLGRVLRDAGWEPAGENDGILTASGPAGETLAADLDAMELTASLKTEKDVVGQVRADGRGPSQRSARQNARMQLEETAAVVGDQIQDSGRREVQTEVTARLEESEEARQRQMNELLQKVYTEALKRKAGQLGEILEVQESIDEDGSYELLIRVAQ